MNMFRRLGTSALLALALVTGVGVAQPASATEITVSASVATVDRLVPVYDESGRLIAFILIREATA